VATIALGIAAVQPADHQRNTDEQSALRKAALDWVELLLTIRGDPLKGNTQMEEMKRRTTDPLQSRFEDSMSPYFQDFAPWSAKPLQITSISRLQAASFGGEQPPPSASTFLLTTTAGPMQRDRGYGFWVNVVDHDGHYLIAGFRATE
jgi:hypothetical protein